MLKKTFITALSIAVFVVALVVSKVFTLSNKDYEEYKKLTHSDFNLTYQKAYQLRQNVQKDIYIIDDNKRKHFRLHSNSSEIFLTQKKKNFELVENLKDIGCCFQDKIASKNSNQHIRYIKANNGIYSFPSHNFLLKDVLISSYYLAGSYLPENLEKETPYLEGICSDAVFSLSSKKPKVQVNSFEATFFPQRGLK